MLALNLNNAFSFFCALLLAIKILIVQVLKTVLPTLISKISNTFITTQTDILLLFIISNFYFPSHNCLDFSFSFSFPTTHSPNEMHLRLKTDETVFFTSPSRFDSSKYPNVSWRKFIAAFKSSFRVLVTFQTKKMNVSVSGRCEK